MLMSEYIRHCRELMEEHGDHEVVDSLNDALSVPEFLDDDGDPVFVAADKS